MKLQHSSRLVTLIIAALCIGASSLAGQISGTLAGPALGYVWSGAEGKLYPVRGILGSATFGPPAEF